MNNKVLVGITIQENSRRLISEGAHIAQSLDAPLDILHIRKGETIFDTPDSSELLSSLFAYGSTLGGEVHFLSSNHVTKTITDFIKVNNITHLVIGESPNGDSLSVTSTVYNKLKVSLGEITLIVLPREDSVSKMA